MKLEFIEKVIEAKKCELEALSLLIPESMKPHMEVIGREIKAMVTKSLSHCAKTEKKNEEKSLDKRVRKIDIG